MSRTQEQMTTYEKALEKLVRHIITEYGGDTVRFYEDMRKAKSTPAPEPAEPRRWKASIKRDNGKLYKYDECDEERLLYEVVEVIEALPGWKLVPPVAGRPLPDGVPLPPDGFDYWGAGPLPHLDHSNECIVIGFCGGRWDDSEGDGLKGSFDGRHYAIRRNTALHAANFGEVGR